MTDRLSAAVARSDHEELHEVEAEVKADRKPERAGALQRQTQQQAEQNDVGDVDGVSSGLREVRRPEKE